MRVSIFSDFSTQFIKKELDNKLSGLTNFLEISEYNYNPIESYFYGDDIENLKENDYFIILESTFYIYDKYLLSIDKDVFSDKEFQRITSYLGQILNQSNSKIILSNYFEFNDKIYGNQSGKYSDSFVYQLRKLNFLISEFIQGYNNIQLLDINSIHGVYGLKFMVNQSLYTNYGVLFSMDGTKVISKNLTDIIKSSLSKIVKCIVVDLDNTIWGGIIGDDGIEKIQIGNVGIGKSFTLIQNWLKLIKNQGIVLCVCSKNDEEIAKSPFLNHPDMVLTLEDITIFIANWDNKDENIRVIKETLNIGYDSIVFLDDNKFERNLVKQSLPEVIVPNLPEDPVNYLDYLINENFMETDTLSKKGKLDRTNLYKTEFERVKLKKAFNNNNDYLKSLKMISSIEEINKFNIPRISELSKRTNQFNLTGIRFNESDLNEIMNSPKMFGFSFNLIDSFGSYGIVSYIILKYRPNSSIEIVNWGMSCRVFKRTLEQFIINQLVLKLKDFNRIEGELIPTNKNKVLKSFLMELGILNKNRIVINIKNYSLLKTSIHNE